MIRNLIVLPDGTEVFSGVTGQAAIRSVTLTQTVNPEQELTPGGVCAAMVEIDLFAPDGFSVPQGAEFTLFHVDDAGSRAQVGIFLAEQPVRTGRGLYTLTGYDRVTCLDRDLSQWLAGLTDWPYSLQTLGQMVCAQCGVTLACEELPNGAFPVNAFSGEGITGRQILSWIGQAAGRFCRARAEGSLEFAWFAPSALALAPGGDCWYYAGSLSREDYAVAPVEKVQIHLTDEDIGCVYPEQTEGNTFKLTGNYLLTTARSDALEPVAETLYQLLRDVTYTPCSLTVSAQLPVEAGDVIAVQTPEGETITAYVMTRVLAGQKQTLSCTGSPRRDSAAAVNRVSYKALSGRVLNLRTEVEGLKAENADAAGNLASLALSVEGIATEVSKQQQQADGLCQQVSGLEQTAAGLTLQIRSIHDDGVSRVVTREKQYTLDDQGLRIRGGKGMENLLDETGMLVSRSGDVVLQATAEGVKAMDITVENYLVVGAHARFEDYTDGTDSHRTACFFL